MDTRYVSGKASAVRIADSHALLCRRPNWLHELSEPIFLFRNHTHAISAYVNFQL